jgi:phospholipase/carboxylesterase
VTFSAQFADADPHAGGNVLRLGPPPEQAPATLIMLHGRGGTAESIASLYPRLDLPNVAALAPQAAGNCWYPNRFLSPLESNQPWIDSALRRVDSLVEEMIGAGVSTDRIGILGFSQGACLASEYVVRHPRKYGAVMILTGSVFGPLDAPRNHLESLEGTPVFIGAGDPDELVPLPHVERTARLLERLGGDVDFRVYAGKPHTVSEAELAACRALIEGIS